MTRELIIQKTISAIERLPVEKAEAVSDFADFICKKFEEEELTKGIQILISDSETFNFLEEEEEIYSLSDLKESYND